MAQITYTLRGGTEPQTQTILDKGELSEQQVREIDKIDLIGAHAIKVVDGDDWVLKFRDGTTLRLKKYVVIQAEDATHVPQIAGIEAAADDTTVIVDDSLMEDRGRNHSLPAELSKPETVLGDVTASAPPPVFSIAPPVFGIPAAPPHAELPPLARDNSEPPPVIPKFDDTKIIGIPDTFNADKFVTGEGQLLFHNSDGKTKFAFDLNPNDRATSERNVFAYQLKSLDGPFPKHVADSILKKYTVLRDGENGVESVFIDPKKPNAALQAVIDGENGHAGKDPRWLKAQGEDGDLYVGKLSGAVLYKLHDNFDSTHLGENEYVRDSFAYKSTDGSFSSNFIPLSIRITGINNPATYVGVTDNPADPNPIGFPTIEGRAIEAGSDQPDVTYDSATRSGTTSTHLSGSLLINWSDPDHSLTDPNNVTPNPALGQGAREGSFHYLIYAKNVPNTFKLVGNTIVPNLKGEDPADPQASSPYVAKDGGLVNKNLPDSPTADHGDMTLLGRYGKFTFHTGTGQWDYQRNNEQISNADKAVDQFVVQLEDTNNHRLIEHEVDVSLAGVSPGGEKHSTVALANYNAIADGKAAMNIFSVGLLAGTDGTMTHVDQLDPKDVHPFLTVDGTFGELKVDRLTGTYTYMPFDSSDAVNKLGHGDLGVDNFAYTVADADPNDANTRFDGSNPHYVPVQHSLTLTVFGSNDSATLQAGQTQFDTTPIVVHEHTIWHVGGTAIGTATNAQLALFDASDVDNTKEELRYYLTSAPHVTDVHSADSLDPSITGTLKLGSNSLVLQDPNNSDLLNSFFSQADINGAADPDHKVPPSPPSPPLQFDATAFRALGEGESATVQFQVTLHDVDTTSLTNGHSTIGWDGSESFQRTVTVTVLGDNDAPFGETFSTNLAATPADLAMHHTGPTVNVSVAENSDTSTVLAAFTAQDYDNNDHVPGTTTLTGGTYTITGADKDLFNINSAGELTFKAPADYENPLDLGHNNVYTIDVGVRDSHGASAAGIKTITIAVDNLNDNPPEMTTPSVLRVLEHTTVVPTALTATDPDGTPPPLSFKIVGGADASQFTIDNSGHLVFNSEPDFQARGSAAHNNSYLVDVQASDGLNPSTPEEIKVQVKATPLLFPTVPVDYAEDRTDAVTTVAVQNLDPDDNSLKYTIIGGTDADKFTLDQNTGALSFKSQPDFEDPQGGLLGNLNNYTVVVRATDDNTFQSEGQTITVTVQDVDEQPVLQSDGGQGTATLPYHVDPNRVVTTVHAADPEHQDITYSIEGGDDQGKFIINPDTGVLRFRTAPDFSNPTDIDGNNSYIVEVGASDRTTATVTQTLTVNVPDPNVVAPIALDLSGQGLNFTGLSSVAAPTLDVNGDGIRDRMAMVRAGTAFLAYDMGGDGLITQRSEIAFVDHAPGTTSDLEALREKFDTNHDNVLNAKDATWKSLGVWSDINHDGTLEASEFETLTKAGIQSIDLTEHGQPEVVADGVKVNGTIQFTKADGTVGTGADVTLSFEAGTATAAAHAGHTAAVAANGTNTTHVADETHASHVSHPAHPADASHTAPTPTAPSPAPAPIVLEESHAQANLHSASGDAHPLHELAGLMHDGGHTDLLEHLGNVSHAGGTTHTAESHSIHTLPPADEVLSSTPGTDHSGLQMLDASHLSDHPAQVKITPHAKAHETAAAHAEASGSGGGGGRHGHTHTAHAGAGAHHPGGEAGGQHHSGADDISHAGATHVASHEDVHLYADAPAAVA